MNEMVKMVAKVLEETASYEDDGHYGESCRYVDNWPELARAAIAAMREPTPEMVEVEELTLICELGGVHDSAFWSDGWPKKIWTSMIDAALEG